MNKIIPVYFSCDDRFLKFTSVAVESMIINANKDYTYRVYILHSDITDENQAIMYNHFNKYNNMELYFVNVSDYLKSINDLLPVRDYYSKTTYYRLLIAKMFTEYDKTIYLDSDMIIKGDISKLYEMELGNNLVGAAHEQAMVQTDAYGDYVEKNLDISRYQFFNAGMLLINSKLWRDEEVFEKFMYLLNIYTFKVTQDEDYLNVICKDRVLFVGDNWNTESFLNKEISDEDINIIHYIMWAKPWHFTEVRYNEFFWKYAKLSPYYNEIQSISDNYTDKQKKKDLQASERLYKLALKEAKREDTFRRILETDLNINLFLERTVS